MKIQVLEEDRLLITSTVRRVDSRRFYVYVHYRISDGRPFYIGKGCRHRCLTVYKRSEYWQKVFNKHGAFIKLAYYDLTFEQSNQKEIELIEELGLENLCNVSKGGVNGLVGSLNHMYGVKLTGELNGNFGNRFGDNPLSIPIVCLDKNGKFVKEYDSSKRCEEDNFNPSTVIAVCRNKRTNHRDHIFVYKSEYDLAKTYSIVRGRSSKRTVHSFDADGNFLKEYPSASSTRADGFNPGVVEQVCRGEKKRHQSIIFKYV